MTYREARQLLEGLHMFGAKPGLERAWQLAGALGHPQERLRFIHVAGTNGKGSTCAMLESIYRHAGLRVGLFTSPHLVAFAERIQVNRRLIPEAEVARLVEILHPAWEALSGQDHPTFFEVVTVLALAHFAREQCDLVIWETGLGGRLDATNIVTPLVSVITNIQYDHQKWLGHTLAEIAFEKAGIIKPGLPVVTAAEAPEAMSVITRLAAERAAPLSSVSKLDVVELLPADLHLPLRGEHQKLNAALAMKVVQTLQPRLPVPESARREGLARVHWPGRLQLVRLGDGRTFLLDGAHNLGGVETFIAGLQSLCANRPPAMILGILRDKDWEPMCRRLAPLAGRLLLVEVGSERTASAADLHAVCAQANPKVQITCHAHLRDALTQAAAEPFVTITGSLYLIGEAMELLHLSPGPVGNERALNEWVASPNRRPA